MSEQKGKVRAGLMGGMIRVGFAGLLSMLLAACAGNSSLPLSEAQRAAADFDYVIGPGDTLEVFVWGNEELSSVGVVRPDGKFTTRLVEDLEASGKTSTQLARDIEQSYGEYVRQPVVSVIVNGFVGVPSQQVRVVGEAAQPASVPFRKHMTLLDLMIAVGGMTEFADGNGSVLVRTGDEGQKSYKLRLDDLLKDGDISANLALMPGDIVIISESWF
ncbi:XrtA/PEP-CTERM system exopolysaccharide export protein [Parahaliea aestuarii]|uniref:Sugar ABC transporter substrate-binding protein n=1 Tax=Parahaliea aestuarii TaxID=1852021 RepID=A0A5C8ZM72_9GAMM|nr:XrtA/PEP-CTERM system exopolysaccharide export protein [Parahaliea aestuarii]TXS89656.1 sugar ABC transporter substrate-binding protein [Parahaliea aestuarii]